MVRLDISPGVGNRSTVKTGFWRRQFLPTPTHERRISDVLFGVVAPVLCFVFDPIVFKGEFGGGLLSEYQLYAYSVSAIEILVLVIWLICGRELQPRTRLVGGVLIAGAIFSLVIGLIILPFTLLGLFLGIGLLGFIPFITGLVYLRNGRSAFQMANNHSAGRSRIAPVVVGCALVLGPPAGFNFLLVRFVSESMNAVIYASPPTADIAVDQLKYLQFFAQHEVNRLVSAYAEENGPSRKEELKRRYARLTGQDIEETLEFTRD